MPREASQVRTERILTFSIAALSQASAAFSPISSPALDYQFVGDRVVDVLGGDAPQDPVAQGLDDLLALLEGGDVQPEDRAAVGLRLMIASCATSTRRRVRYPASAVFRAVSARPFLAPWVEMKYSSTVSPSLKLEVIGVSMISPIWPVIFFWGLAIRPRIPASWRICSLEPLAPEAAIMYTGLNPPWTLARFSNIRSPTLLVAVVQTSITWLYLSPSVIAPLR